MENIYTLSSLHYIKIKVFPQFFRRAKTNKNTHKKYPYLASRFLLHHAAYAEWIQSALELQCCNNVCEA